MEKRHKHLTDGQRLERLASWLDDEYRIGVHMSEDAISDVVSDLKRIASQISESQSQATNKHYVTALNMVLCAYSNRISTKLRNNIVDSFVSRLNASHST